MTWKAEHNMFYALQAMFYRRVINEHTNSGLPHIVAYLAQIPNWKANPDILTPRCLNEEIQY